MAVMGVLVELHQVPDLKVDPELGIVSPLGFGSSTWEYSGNSCLSGVANAHLSLFFQLNLKFEVEVLCHTLGIDMKVLFQSFHRAVHIIHGFTVLNTKPNVLLI